jgi:Tfp pilus assembly protein PilO
MKRAGIILLICLGVAVAAYAGVYFSSTAAHRALLECDQPELAWLKKEFDLSDAELARLSQLHAAYQPHCKEMCRRIDEQDKKLRQLLAPTNTVTPEIEQAIADSARLRGECHRDMLQHFFEVSRTMPPEQGRRYLQWVQQRTFLTNHGMSSPR